MTVRLHTTPGFDYLADVAIAFARTTEHGAALGLDRAVVRTAIGERLAVDAEDGRTTDWALLCDRLTVLADEKIRKDHALSNRVVEPPEPVMPCPGGCGKELDAGKYACIDCWSLLPVSLSQAVKRARGENRVDAARVAIAWLREMLVDGQQKNPPASTFTLADGGVPR
jgi:hypothetical protein